MSDYEDMLGRAGKEREQYLRAVLESGMDHDLKQLACSDLMNPVAIFLLQIIRRLPKK